VLGAGGDDIGGLNWDDGTVGVGHETSVASGVDTVGGDGGNWETVGGQVLSTGSNHSGLVSGDDGAVGVGDQGGSVVSSIGTGVGTSVDTGVGEGSGKGKTMGG